jgi:spore coat protein CotH
LFINNKPAGLYGLIETFQDPWAASQFANGDENYKPGFLYQGQTQGMNQTDRTLYSDLKYYGENLTAYSAGQYKIKAGYSGKDETPEDYTRLKEFTKFINSSTKDTTFEEWNKQLDIEGYIRAYVSLNFKYIHFFYFY